MSGEIKSLTGIRGIAAVYVVLYHTASHFSDLNFIQNGYISVDLFFILSGFIMTYTYHLRFSSNINVKDVYIFLNHRVSRVWPTYIFWTIFTVFFFKMFDLNLKSIISNVLMIQNWGVAPSIVGTGWSVSVELAVYFIFPFLIYFFTKKEKSKNISTFICVFIIVYIAYTKHPVVTGSQMKFNGPLDIVAFDGAGDLMRGFAGFTLGVISWGIFSEFKRISDFAADIISLFLVLILSISLTSKGLDVISVAVFFILIPLIGAKEESFISKLLASKIVYFLGVISYSLYLCHALFVYSIRKEAHILLMRLTKEHEITFWISVMAAIVGSCVIGYLSYILIEKPSRKAMKTRFSFTVN
ncbi:acyltransferase family protein [Lelliottia wanjuensis]|uniref:acyltransferase family protein n=1 Tax=Lelliottia wanjuensis TaxID=3050585 RepID=UPI00254BDEEA|nr:acyltransferase [Lelliottia sp. V106_16]MDK9358407.1 acyltransferase [Lelliottia sp. V106_16]